ncbi:MAG TPA: hypothetical protein VGH38_24025, partial [Bryobacteraceae bacterium]
SVSGEPSPVAQGIPFFRPTAWSEFDASVDGVLVYVTGWQRSQLTWLDRQGKETGTVGTPKEFWSSVRISPDGSKVAVDVSDPGKGGADLWTFDLAKGTAERLTSDPGVEASAVWSPDGTSLAYGSAQAGAPQLRVRALYEQGSGQVFAPGPFQLPNHWSADGRWIFYQSSGNDVKADIWIASVLDRTIAQLTNSSFNASFPALSPNGEYLAFSANDTGRDEVYVQRFDGSGVPKLVGPRKRVSNDGGVDPRWRRDGKELFFVSLHNQMMAAPVNPGPGPEIAAPVLLFTMPTSYRTMSPSGQNYDVSPDGRKFLKPKGIANSDLAVAVINWQAALYRR